MNWSNKWPDPKPKLDPVEAAKVIYDVIIHGTGYLKDGKHITLEDVYIDPPNDHGTLKKLEQSIEDEVGCKPEELTGITTEMLGVDLGIDNSSKTILNFQDGNKRQSIDVIIVGDLALDYDDDGWNIYHVPTGTVFTKAVPARFDLPQTTPEPNYEYEPSELLAWMKKVQEKHDVSWTMLRLLTPDNYNDKGDSAKRIIKEWCLSVPVKE